MKLLFDQNVSPTLVGHLNDVFPGSAHVFSLDLSNANVQEGERVVSSYSPSASARPSARIRTSSS